MYSKLTRQHMRCGWERPLDPSESQLPARAWGEHTGFKPDVDADGNLKPITTCPGYTCGLPEVIEAARARMHWEKGQLALYTQGEQPSENLMRAVEIFDSEIHRLEAWKMTPRSKGGGADG